MTKENKNKILSLILCFVIGFTAAACASKPQPVPQDESLSSLSEPQTEEVKTFVNTLELPVGPYAAFAIPKRTEQVQEKYGQNSDTVGWLVMPDTTIDDVVVWYPGDKNQFYYRRDFDKRQNFNGIYYADYRCAFEGGKAEGLAPNTVIYGHSMSDNPLDNRKMFSPLKFLKDEEFAQETPYVYFSLSEEDLIWEIFAVFFATVDLPYNNPFPSDFMGMVKECTDRSIYTYNTKVEPTDKILTLSTCTYSMPDGKALSYPNEYRYVIMAKLLTDKSALKAQADFVVNESPKAP